MAVVASFTLSTPECAYRLQPLPIIVVPLRIFYKSRRIFRGYKQKVIALFVLYPQKVVALLQITFYNKK
jgi:hypothetical protein